VLKGEAEVIVDVKSYWEEEFTLSLSPESMISSPEIKNDDLRFD
jgi:hypothetical protein